MFTTIIVVITAFVLGLIVGKRASEPAAKKTELDEDAKITAILTLFAHSEKLTNDDVQRALHVSDATAERYLNRAEHLNLITQHGTTGRDVYYTKN